MSEQQNTNLTAAALPEGTVFRASYYPPSFGVARLPLAMIQLTRGRSIIYGERCEYRLDQEWESIEVLWPAAQQGTDADDREALKAIQFEPLVSWIATGRLNIRQIEAILAAGFSRRSQDRS